MTVNIAHGANTINIAKGPTIGFLDPIPRPRDKTIFHSTSESSVR